MKEFYVTTNDHGRVKVIGRAYEWEYNGVKLYTHRSVSRDAEAMNKGQEVFVPNGVSWTVTEAQTGLAVTSGMRTKRDAVEDAKYRLDKHKDKLDEIIQAQKEKLGL